MVTFLVYFLIIFWSTCSVDGLLICTTLCRITVSIILTFLKDDLRETKCSRNVSRLQWFTGRPVCLVAIHHRKMNIKFLVRGCSYYTVRQDGNTNCIYLLVDLFVVLKVIKVRSFARSFRVGIQMTFKPPQMETKIHYHNVCRRQFVADLGAILARTLFEITKHSQNIYTVYK